MTHTEIVRSSPKHLPIQNPLRSEPSLRHDCDTGSSEVRINFQDPLEEDAESESLTPCSIPETPGTEPPTPASEPITPVIDASQPHPEPPASDTEQLQLPQASIAYSIENETDESPPPYETALSMEIVTPATPLRRAPRRISYSECQCMETSL